MKDSKVAIVVIALLSVAIPGLIGVFLYSPSKISLDYLWLKDIPAFNALVNSLTAIFLLMGKRYARQGEILWHKFFMSFALTLGIIFVLAYSLYHSTSASAMFGDANLNGILEHGEEVRIGNLRYFYFAVLLSHIGMSFVVIPFVLFAFYFAIVGNIEKHKNTVKYTWPIWMYVSVTGVLVYFMASPYYPQ
ncbi:MAG: DUF420 domain-containing protein [Reichenbachiella sp.]|uniref:DUF420 domain-containing protein n=1 Tax=Reichenbachiella sp. TaxID=2184521 RepID=UPI0032677367